MISQIQDEQQVDRIAAILESEGRGNRQRASCGVLLGILTEAQNQRSTEMADRYVEITRSLAKENDQVHLWLSNNMSKWGRVIEYAFPQSRQQRGYDHRDPNALSNESDMSEDDSRTGSMMGNENEISDVAGVIVKGAGYADANGYYEYHGTSDGVPMFSRRGSYQNRPADYFVYRCKLSNNDQRYYISIAPPGSKPGTTKDIDFYIAVPDSYYDSLPPETRWNPCNERLGPAPSLAIRHRNESPDGHHHGNEDWNDDSMDDGDIHAEIGGEVGI